MNRSAIALAATFLYACSLAAQAPATQQASTTQTTAPSPALRLNTEEVNLDMVFHDKKGNSIHDIRPEEVHVFEDGVEQHLSSFKYVRGDVNPAPVAPGTAAPATGSIPLDPMRELR